MSEQIIQGSEEWKQLRVGKVTASRISDVMAKTKSGYGAGRKKYMAQLIVERLTGETPEGFLSAAMLWGVENEHLARKAHEAVTGKLVTEVAFVDHPSIEMTGASPDGLIDSDGLVEIKAPMTATHIETLVNKKIDRKYYLQMQWQMACTERLWCDFVSFDPRMPEELQYYTERVNRNDKLIEEISVEVQTFLIELDEKIQELNKLRVK